MIYNEETAQLDEKVDQLIECLQHTEVFKAYQNALKKLNNPDVIQLKKQLQVAKEQYEFQVRLGQYAPQLKEKRKQMMQAKRNLDLNEAVAHFRQCESNLQGLLDQVVEALAQTVDEDILIEFGSPFTKQNCGGNCHE